MWMRLVDCSGYTIWSVQVDLQGSALFSVAVMIELLICNG